RTLPPRHDTARQVEWDLHELAGRDVYVEIQDGDAAGAYAWLAVGRFSVDGLNPQPFQPVREACRLVAVLQLDSLHDRSKELVESDATSWETRREAAGALIALRPDARRLLLMEAAGETRLAELRELCLRT